MRLLSLLAVGVLAACAQQPAPQSLVQRAMSRAGVSNARALEVRPDRVMLAEPLRAPLAESDVEPAYRIWSYDASKDRAQVLLERAGWAAWAGDSLIAVELGELRLHRGGATRTLLAHAAPDFAIDSTGKWIAAIVRRPELALDTDLVLIRADGGPVRTLAAFDGSSESRPIFTPDNRAVIFVSGKTGLASLYRVELLDGRITQLTNVGMRGGAGLPKGFVPPPPDVASMHFDGNDTLVYGSVRVHVRGAR